MTKSITKQIQKINLHVFNITSIISNDGINNQNRCPKCKTKFMRFNANSISCRLYCTRCFWEIYYMVINKNA